MLKSTFKILPAIVALLLCVTLGHATTTITHTFPDETLNYKVMYKWGLVHKQAGRATLSIRNSGPHYHTLLTARSENWADKFYKVRDTLSGIIIREGFRPTIYTKIAHEGGDHKHDQVKYVYSGSRIIGNSTRLKWDDKGKLTRNEQHKLEAMGTTVDMLSSFYYMRALPYQNWKPGNVVSLNIYSGKTKELLTIKYLGTENVKCDNTTYACYHIRFSFTSDGQKKSSDDLDAWISTDSRRIPIKMEGKLKVGKVQCFYTGTSS